MPPEHISEEEYIDVKDNRDKYPDYYVGYIGFHGTFGAKYFGGYGRGYKKDGTPRDMSNETFRNTMSQLPHVQDVEFICGDYRAHFIKNAVVYCDPPYRDTTKYSTESFDYEEFWDWCREISDTNHVFISEYNAPDDFECIWSKQHIANFDCNRGDDMQKKIRVEKLFTYKK